jgi:putative ATPase
VEKGTIKLLGATTENPFFSLTAPLLSRCTLLELKPLSPDNVKTIVLNAIKTALPNIEITEEAINSLSAHCSGDPRIALNALELASQLAEPNVTKGTKVIDQEGVGCALQKNILKFDKTGDNHYDQISAFIKSMRGSDPDATLYWLARLLESGEEPRYIARRMIIHAAEDVGLADPSVLQSAIAAQQALEVIGMPEAKIPMAMAALHIALAPKSNSSCLGIKLACDFIKNHPNAMGPVPKHLRDAHYAGAETLGNGIGYLYPHNYQSGVIDQTYLPEKCGKPKLYQAKNLGIEGHLNQQLKDKK